ncbi:MAG: diguanylate cyclase, partial [Ruminococcus sp.]|nr:diguanylate cyclase [Ruminococcus sp.]
MINNDPIFIKIAEALLIEYTSVYYVNAKTNEYQWYSADPEFQSLHIEQGGEDFFKNLIRDADKVVYEEDKHIFMKDIQKENLLAQVEKGTIHNIEYRLVIDGKPVYHALRLIRGISRDDDYFILGVQNVDELVKKRQQAEKYEQEREIYNQIAGSLAGHYDTLYYVNMETNEYFEYSSTDIYKSMQVPTTGSDFFTESNKNLKKYVHPDDQARVIPLYEKKNMLRNLNNVKLFTDTYRLVINGTVMHCRCSQIWASDKKHILVGIENINEEVQAKEAFEKTKRQSTTYGQMVNSLALRYDLIYYVNSNTGEYSKYSSGVITTDPSLSLEGLNFFTEAVKLTEKEVHPQDKDRILNFIDKDYIISSLESTKQYSADYRRVVGGRTEHTRLTVMRSSDNVHFIVGLENIDEEVKKEQEQIQALDRANELARRDGLTGTRNMTAYREFEESMQKSMDSVTGHSPFAIVICDINDLKHINDSKGHKAGDEYIRSACRLICGVFAHSPVFRLGGDEFAAVLAGSDYEKRIQLVEMMKNRALENLKKGDGPVVAVGLAVYDRLNDRKVSDVFNRADNNMYEDKVALKSGKPSAAPEKPANVKAQIPAERKRMLDGL